MGIKTWESLTTLHALLLFFCSHGSTGPEYKNPWMHLITSVKDLKHIMRFYFHSLCMSTLLESSRAHIRYYFDKGGGLCLNKPMSHLFRLHILQR